MAAGRRSPRRPCSLVHRLVLGARRVLARIDPDIDHRRPAGLGDHLAASPQRGRDLRGLAHLLALAAPHLRRTCRTVMSPSRLPTLPRCSPYLADLAVADLVHRRVVADDREIRRAEAVGRLHVERGHAERAVAVVAEHFLLRDARAWRPCAKPVPTPSEPSAPGSIHCPGRADARPAPRSSPRRRRRRCRSCRRSRNSLSS